MKKMGKKEEKMKGKNKKGVAIEGLVWWIIAIAVLVIMIVLAVIFRAKLAGIGAYIKNIFRFR
tara:strand:- start:1144 stop:1332 length:189 start_codon:yes stop_codon:yes gene_type:complete